MTINETNGGQNMEVNQSRRAMLKQAGLAGAGIIAGGVLASSVAKAAALKATPPQTEGPFYPVRDQVDKDADMTRVKGQAGTALGEKISLRGKVVDAQTGAPLAGALVEFWQACASGRYNHPEDTNTAPIDPNFQYWAQVRTDASGLFNLLSIRPGAYPATPNWIRPAHIHVKVHQAGYPSLTTQLYFKGDPYNATDSILQNVPAQLRDLVVVDFKPGTAQEGLVGEWTIFIKKFAGANFNHDSVSVTPEIDD